jgi:glutamine amidotransferase
MTGPIVIVDYGMCNLGSVLNMLKRIGITAKASADPEAIKQAKKLLLPGVGAFDTGMRRLVELKLISLLEEKVLVQKTPVMGICLGMQLLTRGSQEGTLPGLGWIAGETRRFEFGQANGSAPQLKVPHMGWNTIRVQRNGHLDGRLLFEGLGDDARFYFVHSYYVRTDDLADVLATTDYGGEFVSAIHRDNIWGTQFHPEKSHKFGMRVLKNFAEME